MYTLGTFSLHSTPSRNQALRIAQTGPGREINEPNLMCYKIHNHQQNKKGLTDSNVCL